jgi:drug/metabolite transporter (DMT)-like permease
VQCIDTCPIRIIVICGGPKKSIRIRCSCCIDLVDDSICLQDFAQISGFSPTTLLRCLGILLLKKKIHLLSRCSQKDYVKSALLGFLNPFLYYVVLLKAYSVLPAQQAVSLNYTWAIQLVILSIPILKQKIRLKSITAIVVSYFGVVIIATHGDIAAFRVANLEGVLLAIGSAIIWALFWIYNIKDKRDAVVKLFLNFLFGFAYICVYVIITQKAEIPTLFGLFGAAYVGVFEMGITFVLWLTALRLSKTTAQVSNMIYLTPFLALLIINVSVGERILISTFIGLILIVTGIILQQYPRHLTRQAVTRH